MGRKSKTGKSRKDKFYHLAKETGYRARSAFKLIQLNRKFEFLQRARVVIDLCAAPGGWLQVVAENTPVSSIILGVDLVPIRPISKVKTLVDDITTDKCRQDLKKELHTWKADAVLNDGAPNVGKNWLHDAFQQAQLALQALKLAVEFLKKGGWFVTKVFRSKDYYSLLWVFQQLFKHVHATKPQASRNESAEIFVVCEKFLAPDKIDPKFLDPKYVFKDVEDEPKPGINLIHPEKKRRQREGYPTGDYTLFHSLKASEFVQSDNYLDLLAQSNEIVVDLPEIANHKETTTELKECLKDIKVLGKREIRNIISWRKKIMKDIVCEEQAPVADKQSVEEDSEDEEAQLDEKLAELKEEERKALKRKLKKVRREKTKLRHKMDMKMVIPGDRHDFSDDVSLFNLNKIKSKSQLDSVEKGDSQEADEMAMEEDEEVDKVIRRMRSYDRDSKDHLDDLDPYSDEEGEEEPEFLYDPANDDLEFEEEEEEENPLVVSLQDKHTMMKNRSKAWFSKASFADIEGDEDEDMELQSMAASYKKKGGKILDDLDSGLSEDSYESDLEMSDRKLSRGDSSGIEGGLKDDGDDDEDDDDDDDDDSDDDDDDSDSDYDINEMRSKKNTSQIDKSSKKAGFEVVPKDENLPKLDAIGMAIGSQIVESRKRKREIVEGGYHRYMFNDDNLPDWFVKDESKHLRVQLPVTKGEIEEYKMKMKALNARPIKKIAEAKARKKRKDIKKLERVRKKAEAISDTADVADRDKWMQIKQIYKKAGLLSQKKKEITYVVAKKGTGKRVRRPHGVQGLFKVVDPRMKKDHAKDKKSTHVRGKGKGKKGKTKGGKRMGKNKR
ncbi:pre-rRNA 2'-O-ribose RNA methyltransferase FTSJ3-like [Ostrea edulis]|uniref:pre-rRNA 2'-O-ribose RNA methyltransferase FTSJ3-like n=1 Tax=Ostrea edulis TaxID=37623 RepID=UPI002095C837|nr:pre-rRNA 2'-O-ribose RNA methyltransferase FTSJ3-like [Ostrea edulis]